MNRSVIAASLVGAMGLWGCTSTGAQGEHGAAAGPQRAGETTAWRKAQPQPGPEPTLEAPIPKRQELQNGLSVYAVPNRRLPLVHARVVIRCGSSCDPADLPGVAGFTADMLKAGTKQRSAEMIAAQVENRGSSIYVGVDEDSITVSATALRENFDAVFDVMADVLQNSVFAPAEIQRVRKQRLASLEQAKSNPSTSASRVFRRVLYGAHPYGHTVLGNAEAVSKIGEKDVRQFYAEHFSPSNAAAIIVGDLDTEAAFAAVRDRLGEWKVAQSANAAGIDAQPSTDTQSSIYLVGRPGAPQSQLRIGHVGVARSNPDYFALTMCNAILGGLFNSRINMNLREDKGYTYGARSYFDFLRGPGPFFVATGVRTDVTEAAIREVFKEIDRMRGEDVSAVELQNAKNRYTLSLPGYFQTVSRVGGMVERIFVFDLPLDYYQQLPANIDAVTIEDVRRVAQKHLRSDEMKIVVVGDKDQVEAGLAKLDRGPVQLRDPEGNLL